MSLFESLPNEIIVYLCGELKTPDLSMLSQVNSNLHELCGDKVKERKATFLIEKLIGRDGSNMNWRSGGDDLFSVVLILDDNDKLIIRHHGRKFNEYLRPIHPILPGMKSLGENITLMNVYSKKDINKLELLYNNLISNNYKRLMPSMSKELYDRILQYSREEIVKLGLIY